MQTTSSTPRTPMTPARLVRPSGLTPGAVAARVRAMTAGQLVSWAAFWGLFVLMLVFRPVPLGGFTSWTFVSGVSMEPTLRTGDLAIVMPQAAYSVGDIISYHPTAVPDGQIIHRIIVGGDAQNGFVVKGDNKPDPDPDRPKPDVIVGKAVLIVPGAGWLLNTLRHPFVLAALAALTVMGVAWDELRKRQPGGAS